MTLLLGVSKPEAPKKEPEAPKAKKAGKAKG